MIVVWNLNLLKNVVTEEDIDLIMRMPINRTSKVRIIWHYDKYGLHNFKSGYKWYQKSWICSTSSSTNSMETIWKNIGKLKVSFKIKSFIWRALKDIFPTRLNQFLLALSIWRIMIIMITPHSCSAELKIYGALSLSRLWLEKF